MLIRSIWCLTQNGLHIDNNKVLLTNLNFKIDNKFKFDYQMSLRLVTHGGFYLHFRNAFQIFWFKMKILWAIVYVSKFMCRSTKAFVQVHFLLVSAVRVLAGQWFCVVWYVFKLMLEVCLDFVHLGNIII